MSSSIWECSQKYLQEFSYCCLYSLLIDFFFTILSEGAVISLSFFTIDFPSSRFLTFSRTLVITISRSQKYCMIVSLFLLGSGQDSRLLIKFILFYTCSARLWDCIRLVDGSSGSVIFEPELTLLSEWQLQMYSRRVMGLWCWEANSDINKNIIHNKISQHKTHFISQIHDTQSLNQEANIDKLPNILINLILLPNQQMTASYLQPILRYETSQELNFISHPITLTQIINPMILHLPIVENIQKTASSSIFNKRFQAGNVKNKQGRGRVSDGIGKYMGYENAYSKQHIDTQQTQTLERKQLVGSYSPVRGSLSPEVVRKHNYMKKSTDKINSVFNRTRVDWQHNFVGEKYLKKIKEEKKCKKFASCTIYRINKKPKAKLELTKFLQQLKQQNTQPLLNYVQKQKSKDQLDCTTIAKAKTMKQNKRRRAKTMFYSNSMAGSPDKKQIFTQEIQRLDAVKYYKLEPISPWEDNYSLCMWVRKS